VLPLLAVGCLWLILWRGRWGLVGLAPVLASAVLWVQTERPALLISESGGLLGLMADEGRVLSKSSGEAFVARSWLENDGDATEPEQAALRGGFLRGEGRVEATVGSARYVHLYGRGWAERLAGACADGTVVMARKLADVPPDCTVLDADALAQTGTIAVYLKDGRAQMLGAKQAAGARPWTR